MTLTLPDDLIARLMALADKAGQYEWAFADTLVEMCDEFPVQRNQALGTYAQIDTRRSYKTLQQMEATARIWNGETRADSYDLPLQTLRACITAEGLPDYEAARKCFEGELSVEKAWDLRLNRTEPQRLLARFWRKISKLAFGWSAERRHKAEAGLAMLQEALQDE